MSVVENNIKQVENKLTLHHDRHSPSVDSAYICLLEQIDYICFTRFLQRQDSMRIEVQPIPKVLRHLTYEPGKRQLAEQEIGGLLVLPAHGRTVQYEGARGTAASRQTPDLSQGLSP